MINMNGKNQNVFIDYFLINNLYYLVSAKKHYKRLLVDSESISSTTLLHMQ